jgi:hypothetical protein
VTSEESFRIAGRARLFQLLSRRPELRSPERDFRIDRALIENSCCLHLFDAMLVVGATDLDRLCGRAVSILKRRASSEILDLLSELDPERLCALYYALPKERRPALLRHGDWAWCVNRSDACEVEERLIDIECLVRDTPPTELGRAIAVAHLGGEFEVPVSLSCLG